MPEGRLQKIVRDIPVSRILSGSEVIRVLGRQVFDDARQAGWLKPCCTKVSDKKGGNDRPLYARRAVEEVQDRMESGEYPGQRARL